MLNAECLITVPDLGSGRLRVTVSCWLTHVGEVVREGDRVVELSLPGMTFDVSSPGAGQLVSILKSSGDEVQPGDVLGELLPVDEA